MKTVVHASIDGFEVVLGFGNADGFIDPQATYAKIGDLIRETDEARAMADIGNRIASRQAEYRALAQQAETARQSGDGNAYKRAVLAVQAKDLEIQVLNDQAVPIVSAFEARRAVLFAEHAEYAKPPQGEDLIADVQAEELKSKHALRGYGRALLMDGTTAPDLRRGVCWMPKPWKRVEILKLGQDWPAGAIVDDQLTDDQRAEIAVQQETDRVASLSPDARAAEAAQAQASALQAAAQKRSELEISGDTGALAKSQAEYQNALLELDVKYGTELAGAGTAAK